MHTKYHSLLELIDGKWTIQFGDYSKKVVIEECDDQQQGDIDRTFKIITTGDEQVDIEAAVAKLNEGSK